MPTANEAQIALENPEWKRKYRDSVLELEQEEKRWRDIEAALRRLIGRLCAAGMGVDRELDTELSALAAANRRQADAQELERLAASLTTAVVRVDNTAPAAKPAPPWDSTRAAAARILTCLQALRGDDAVVPLGEGLRRAQSDMELAQVLDKTALLVKDYTADLARERLQSAAVLAQVTQRLEEVAGYLAESGAEARTRYDDSADVNRQVLTQVRELSAEVASATELKLLQTQVHQRLEAVTLQVQAFRSREESRLLEQTSRADRMRARIADLERETQDLNSRLDRERSGARLDPLTRLANRKSFDERMTQELARSSVGGVPVSLLLWDVDHFKGINDSYGHRAGDRVLQSVAACLVAGVRAEDFVGRIGGEEFVVLLTGLDFVKARAIADELRSGVEALRFHFRGKPVRVTISCGLTELKSMDSAAAAFDRADAALYRAKDAGRNTCVAA